MVSQDLFRGCRWNTLKVFSGNRFHGVNSDICIMQLDDIKIECFSCSSQRCETDVSNSGKARATRGNLYNHVALNQIYHYFHDLLPSTDSLMSSSGMGCALIACFLPGLTYHTETMLLWEKHLCSITLRLYLLAVNLQLGVIGKLLHSGAVDVSVCVGSESAPSVPQPTAVTSMWRSTDYITFTVQKFKDALLLWMF